MLKYYCKAVIFSKKDPFILKLSGNQTLMSIFLKTNGIIETFVTYDQLDIYGNKV